MNVSFSPSMLEQLSTLKREQAWHKTHVESSTAPKSIDNNVLINPTAEESAGNYDIVEISYAARHSQIDGSASGLTPIYKSEEAGDDLPKTVKREKKLTITYDVEQAEFRKQQMIDLNDLTEAINRWPEEAKAKGLGFNAFLKYQDDKRKEFIAARPTLWGTLGIDPRKQK